MENRESVLNRLKIEKSSAINKLIIDLTKYDITFEPTDNGLENVVFERYCVKQKIAWNLFYRYSGKCARIETILKNKNSSKNSKSKNNETNLIIQITDESFYDWIKMLILFGFKIEHI